MVRIDPFSSQNLEVVWCATHGWRGGFAGTRTATWYRAV